MNKPMGRVARKIRNAAIFCSVVSGLGLAAGIACRKPLNDAIYRDLNTRTTAVQAKHHKIINTWDIDPNHQAIIVEPLKNQTPSITGSSEFQHEVLMALGLMRETKCSIPGFDNWGNYVDSYVSRIVQIENPRIEPGGTLLGKAVAGDTVLLADSDAQAKSMNGILKVKGINPDEPFYRTLLLMLTLAHEAGHQCLGHILNPHAFSPEDFAELTAWNERQADAVMLKLANDYAKEHLELAGQIQTVAKSKAFLNSGMFGRRIEDYSPLANIIRVATRIMMILLAGGAGIAFAFQKVLEGLGESPAQQPKQE